MSKNDFLKLLRKNLSHLPKEEVEERINFYSEMIDDQIEEGTPEEEIISKITSSSDFQDLIATQEDKIKKRRLTTTEVILLAVGSPVWFPILLAIVIVVFAAVFTIVISFWAAFISLTAVSCAGLLYGIVLSITNNLSTGLAIIGASLVIGGLSILFFYLSKYTTKYSFLLCKKTFSSLKNKKEEQ
jgi:uncharacterized membrane protein